MIQPPNAPPDKLPLPWANRPKFYAKDGVALQLVALSEVVRWLMHAKELPFFQAAQVLHDALLAKPEKLALYFFDEEAKVMKAVLSKSTPEYSFGFKPDTRVQYSPDPDKPSDSDRYYGGPSTPSTFPPGVTPGSSAALCCLQRDWCRFGAAESVINASSSWNGKHLAMPCDQAAAIWGGVATVAAVEPVIPGIAPASKADPVAEWTGERLAAQQALFEAGGHRNYAARTWELAGVKERDGRRLVSEYQATIKAGGVVSSVFDMGKKVVKTNQKRA